jgi:hypothetical protein
VRKNHEIKFTVFACPALYAAKKRAAVREVRAGTGTLRSLYRHVYMHHPKRRFRDRTNSCQSLLVCLLGTWDSYHQPEGNERVDRDTIFAHPWIHSRLFGLDMWTKARKMDHYDRGHTELQHFQAISPIQNPVSNPHLPIPK